MTSEIVKISLRRDTIYIDKTCNYCALCLLYRSSWVRSGSIMSPALLKASIADAARAVVVGTFLRTLVA